MPSDCISYQKTGFFTELILDYLDQKQNIAPLYHRFPKLENFKAQIHEKQSNYSADRNNLADVLLRQYENVETSEATNSNIESLRAVNTFTITTGHQLNLFTGPMYFLYKIISTINLTTTLKAEYPENNFVPVYWMATEDHDFDEINYFNFKGKKFRWSRESSGAVGRLSTDGLDDFFTVFSANLGVGKNAAELKRLFSDAYLKNKNLTDATRFLANELFADQGLVIIDGDDRELKREFIPFVKEELETQISHQKVAEASLLLKQYNVQVNPREINLFYLDENLRERIVLENGQFIVNNSNLRFSKEELLKLVDAEPEKFSPNVIMRPLYQEVILPNLCYIGGGGEIAYWLQLKSFFEASRITFPMLLLRNSALIASKKQSEKLEKLHLNWEQLFLKHDDLLNNVIETLSDKELHFTDLKKALEVQFDTLKSIAEQTDKSFVGAVKAQEHKQLRGLENLEKKLRRAEKRKHAEQLERIISLQDELFPFHSLQERFSNFSEFYLEYGDSLIENLIAELDPTDLNFKIVVA